MKFWVILLAMVFANAEAQVKGGQDGLGGLRDKPKKLMNALEKLLTTDQLKKLVGAKEGGEMGSDEVVAAAPVDGSGADNSDEEEESSGSGSGDGLQTIQTAARSLASDTQPQEPEPKPAGEKENDDAEGNGSGDPLGNDAGNGIGGLPGDNLPGVDGPNSDLGADGETAGPENIAGESNKMPQELKKPTGLPKEDVMLMLKLLQKAANHRKIAEEQLLLVGNIFAKNGFVGKNHPQRYATLF